MGVVLTVFTYLLICHVARRLCPLPSSLTISCKQIYVHTRCVCEVKKPDWEGNAKCLARWLKVTLDASATL